MNSIDQVYMFNIVMLYVYVIKARNAGLTGIILRWVITRAKEYVDWHFVWGT